MDTLVPEPSSPVTLPAQTRRDAVWILHAGSKLCSIGAPLSLGCGAGAAGHPAQVLHPTIAAAALSNKAWVPPASTEPTQGCSGISPPRFPGQAARFGVLCTAVAMLLGQLLLAHPVTPHPVLTMRQLEVVLP